MHCLVDSSGLVPGAALISVSTLVKRPEVTRWPTTRASARLDSTATHARTGSFRCDPLSLMVSETAGGLGAATAARLKDGGSSAAVVKAVVALLSLLI